MFTRAILLALLFLTTSPLKATIYLEPSPNFKPKIAVACLYIEYNDKDHFTYHTYRVHFDGDPSAVKINFKEHKGFTWVTPQDALKYELIEDEDACFKLHYGLQ